MSHIDCGHCVFLLDPLDLHPHFYPECRIQVTEGFVQQE